MPDELELSYDTYVLPTAQHRAGLAGLVALATTLRRRDVSEIPEITFDSPGKVRLRLTEKSLTVLFNDLYDATTQEVRELTPRRRHGEVISPLRTETETRPDTRTGKPMPRLVYVYPQTVPRGTFLEDLGMPAPWLKLWRDVLWSVVRGIPMTRGPYEDRAKGRDVREARAVWRELQGWDIARRDGRASTAEISGALLLGAMARNAEAVPFVGSPDQNLLLHFWPVVMGAGEVWRMKRGSTGDVEEEPAGYVVVIPDVVDVDWFREIFERQVGGLDTQLFRYRPRSAVLALPEEAGLEYLHRVLALAAARAEAGEIRFTIAGTEVYHLEKEGNSVHIFAAGQVAASRELLDAYESIRQRYHNLTFRGQLIRNLLGRRPWYGGFERIFSRYERELFIGRHATSFSGDARRRFRVEFESAAAAGLQKRREHTTMDGSLEISKRVHDMIQRYVYEKTKAKTGETPEDFPIVIDPETKRERRAVSEKYRDVFSGVCEDAFLAMRSCRSREDFVAYFTGAICAVPQNLPTDDYQKLAAALLGSDDGWEHVKALAMLALSALSSRYVTSRS